MKILCRWFGHKPRRKLHDPLTYAIILAHALSMGRQPPPHGRVVCARCGIKLWEIKAETIEQLAERLSK